MKRGAVVEDSGKLGGRIARLGIGSVVLWLGAQSKLGALGSPNSSLSFIFRTMLRF